MVEFPPPGYHPRCEVQQLLKSYSLGGVASSINTDTITDERDD